MILYSASSVRKLIWNCLLFTFLIGFASCSKQAGNDGEYSEEFTVIMKNTEKLWAKDKVKQGLDYMDTAFNKIRNPTHFDRFRYYGFHYVYYQKTINQYDKSLLYADSMLAVNQKIKNPKIHSQNIAEANFARGDALFELKQFSDAYESYYRGYYAGKDQANVNMEALGDYTYRMGMIMYKKANYRIALNYFKDTYRFFKNSGDGFVFFYRRQELFDNVGLCFSHLNQPDSALVYFDKALKHINDNGYRYPERKLHLEMAKGVVYGNMADIYITKQSYKPAIELLKKSIAINLKAGYDNHDAQLTEIKLGQIYFNTNQQDSLVNLLGNLRQQFDTVRNADAEADYNRLLGNYYVQQSKLKEAIVHIQRYNLMKDSLIKRSSLLMATDVNQQLANYEKQHEIDSLNNNNKLQRIYSYAVTIVAVLAAVIMFLIYRNWRRSKNDVLTVNILNQQINEQNKVLENALTELKTRSQEKDRILRTVAHDLRNPIGGIASLTTLMAEDEYTDEQKEMINLLKETSINSLELINEILEATNLNSVELNLEPVEINSLVNNSVELLRFKAAEKGQTIILEPLDKQLEICISREKIWRVISNLISNAIKFSPTGGVIHVKVADTGSNINIAVKDNGIGIPDKLKDQVFNMFTSAQRPGTAGEKSFGLGLSICRQIMEKHHGSIWFESNADNGTTFFISLPNVNAVSTANAAQKISQPTA